MIVKTSLNYIATPLEIPINLHIIFSISFIVLVSLTTPSDLSLSLSLHQEVPTVEEVGIIAQPVIDL